jgi:hypothetical protein
LTGNTRDEIATNNGIGARTVSNILNKWKKGIDSKDYDSIRELSVCLKSEGGKFNDLGSVVRFKNYIIKLGPNFDQIESLSQISLNQKITKTS